MQAHVSPALAFAAFGLCAAMLGPSPSLAGDAYGGDVAVRVEIEVSPKEAPRWRRHPVVAAAGPAIYYGYYPDHIPGYPVPIFPTHRPVVAHRLVVSHELSAHHVRWCHERYRSYRARDNSFQPFHGPRRQCRSPFG